MEIISTDELVGSWLRTCHGAWIDLMHGARASAESFSGARGWLIISPNSSGCPKARRHSIKKVYQVGYVKYCSLLNKAHEVIKNNLILAFFALKLTRISICAQKKICA
jgi:hypothetical protein